MRCQYCENRVPLVSGDVIYPHRPDLAGLQFYHCEPCGAWVGCHKGTDRALGRLANTELRHAKMRAHAAFDQLWREGQQPRTAAYRWLAQQLGIEAKQCHIGSFDVPTCERVVEVCTAMGERDAARR